jgi:hypothetical protein
LFVYLKAHTMLMTYGFLLSNPSSYRTLTTS